MDDFDQHLRRVKYLTVCARNQLLFIKDFISPIYWSFESSRGIGSIVLHCNEGTNWWRVFQCILFAVHQTSESTSPFLESEWDNLSGVLFTIESIFYNIYQRYFCVFVALDRVMKLKEKCTLTFKRDEFRPTMYKV